MSVKSPGADAFRWKGGDGHVPSPKIVVDAERAYHGSLADSIIHDTDEMLVLAGALAGRQDVLECVDATAHTSMRSYILADGAETGRKVSRHLGERALVRYMDGFAAGIILADPHTKPTGAFLCGRPESDSWIALSRRQVQDAYHIMRWAFWERATGEYVNESVRKCRSLGLATSPEGDWVRVQAVGHSRISDRIDEMLRNDNKNITVLNPHWDDHTFMVTRLCSASRGGADIRIITHTNGGSVSPELREMVRAGITVLGFAGMDVRAILTDGPCLVVSGELGLDCSDSRFQIGVELNRNQSQILRRAANGWVARHQFRCERVTDAAKS